MSDRGTGKGQPLTFRCSRCRKSKWIGGCATIVPGSWTRHCSHRQVRTGRVRKARKSTSRRMLKESHEYRCQCGHAGWSRHRDVASLPMTNEGGQP